MMPEREQHPGGESEDDDTASRVVPLRSRGPGSVPPAPDAAVPADPDVPPEPAGPREPDVVDLRDGVADASSVPPPFVEPGSLPNDDPPGARGTGPVAARTSAVESASRDRAARSRVVVPAAVSARLLRSLGPAALALLVGTAVAVTALVLAAGASSRADEIAAARDDNLAIGGALSEAWTGALESVAGGVGQQLEGADRSLSSLALVDRLLDQPVPTGGDADLVAATRAEQRRGADALAAAIVDTDADPVDLGNRLEALDAEVRAAAAAGEALDADLGSLERDARDDAELGRTVALLAAVAGSMGAVLAALLARRRWSRTLDRPLDELRRAAAGPLGDDGDGPAARVLADGAAQPELRSLADDLLVARRRDELRQTELEDRVDWVDRGRRVLEALELADDEASTLEVSGRALAAFGPDVKVELLMSAKGSSRLDRVAGGAGRPLPGCPVSTAGDCVAMRRGQVSVFDSSESINACPFLRGRPEGACSAACVPVVVAGRPSGVLHLTGPDGSPPAPVRIEQLVSLSSQLGARFSALRTLERSRQEAATDGLTGLPNRRTLEAEVAELLDRGTPFAMVLADLDRFKKLNDNYGHEIGDRALQLFAGVLRDNVRGNDVVARLGGEEFVLVYPTMSVEISIEAIGRLRQALASALARTDLPSFTCSFGVAHSSVGADGDAILRVADAGLLRAKHLGGDQAVVADAELAAEVFRDGGPGRSERPETGGDPAP